MAQDNPPFSPSPVRATPSLGWFARRAAIGVTLLFVFVVSIAWLTHTSLQADTDGAAAIDDGPSPTQDAAVVRAAAPGAFGHRQVHAD